MRRSHFTDEAIYYVGAHYLIVTINILQDILKYMKILQIKCFF